ncbi:uncharacterized protein LOC143074221 [Mytilus galloprovincialis]|uniref:uncharacterized protein LOC143074221 n=1 Tax=Mytilus galloprovincialis TaxID=29158 RepID=UPI003F7B422B
MPELKDQIAKAIEAIQRTPTLCSTPDTDLSGINLTNNSILVNDNDNIAPVKSFNDDLGVHISQQIIGSSIVKHAFTHARTTYDGIHLGLKREKCTIWWQGKGGMNWQELVPRIKYLLRFEQEPDFLIIHYGGNNIGSCNMVEDTLKYPAITWNENGLFNMSGVHLSNMGNELFLYRIQSFLQEVV